jgi:tripartite-type tricarboxylate transporter receptor subunit TctC
MKKLVLTRRSVSLGLLMSAANRSLAFADDYPRRTIRLIVPFSPAGVVDVVMRIVSAKLGPELNGNIIVENKPGASGLIGSEYVANAAPDGYTLVAISSTTHALAPQLFESVPYDPINDFVPIAQLTSAPTILVVPPSLPVNSVEDLVALAKKDPDQLNFASYGRGSAAHLAAEQFKIAADVKISHIPYKGSGPVISDMIGGSVKLDLFFDSLPVALPYVKDGRLKALAVTGRKRVAELPNVPALAEIYPGFEMLVWQGFGAPAKTPPGVIAKLHDALTKVMTMSDVREKLQILGADPMCTTPQEFGAYIKRENERWAHLIKKMGIERQRQ